MRTKECDIKVLLFDFFGTVVDWHGTIVDALRIVMPAASEETLHTFANRWHREGYLHSVVEIANGRMGWRPVEEITLKKLTELLAEHAVNLPEENVNALNGVWGKFRPWIDVSQGLLFLKKNYYICPFTNGDLPLIMANSKSQNLPWDFILTASMFKKYKPDPEIYTAALNMLGIRGCEALLVAAHFIDLDAAKKAGLCTAFVERPEELGPHQKGDLDGSGHGYDFCVQDFLHLEKLIRL